MCFLRHCSLPFLPRQDEGDEAEKAEKKKKKKDDKEGDEGDEGGKKEKKEKKSKKAKDVSYNYLCFTRLIFTDRKLSLSVGVFCSYIRALCKRVSCL